MHSILRLATRSAPLAVAIALCAGWTAPADAHPVTFEFTGSITDVLFTDGDPYSGAIAVGNPFSGRFTFESGAPDDVPEAEVGLYSSPGFPYGFEMSMGGLRFDFHDKSKVLVRDNVMGADLLGAIGCSQQQTGVCEDWQTVVYFLDYDQTVFKSAALPLSSLPIDAFEYTVMKLYGNGWAIDIGGTMDSLACVEGCGTTPTPVAEPGTLLLLGSALTLVARRIRRNQA